MRLALGLALLALAGPAFGQALGGGEAAQPMAVCGGDLARLNQLSGWQGRWPRELAAIAALPAAEQENALERWRAAPASLRAEIETLRTSLAQGKAAPAAVARRVLDQVDGLLAAGIAPGLTDAAWRTFLDGELKAELTAYANFLRQTYIPAAPDGSSLAGSPGGRACFEGAVKTWSSRAITADELEAMGRRDLAAYRAELTRLAGLPPESSAKALEQVRGLATRSTATREDILRLSQDAIARAQAAAPRAFDAAGLAPLEVRPVPAALESSLPAGLYEPAGPGRPAAYAINLSRPGERRAMVEAIAFHEGAPGHHLAFSMAKAPGTFNSGFVEGWAIYAEHLADELGLYSSAEDRMGAAAKHLWAASRLVVEPGLHVHGWSRQQAIDFLRQNTALPDAEIAIEVDRYLALPGQSVAYMVGYDSIRRARERTERREGAGFDLKRFHARLLEPGPRGLEALETEFGP